MATLGARGGILVVLALLLFVASVLLALLAGMGFVLALIWNTLNVLGIAYSVLQLSHINNAYLVAADFIDSVIFILLAFFLASWFYGLVKSINIGDKLIYSRIKRLSGHVIVMPYNSFAESLVHELDSAGVSCVIISEDRHAVDALRNKGHIALLGAMSSANLMHIAGIEKASYVVACGDDDTLNTLIAVTAKSANKNVRVLSRAKKEENIPKISKAGVYRIILPESSAGERIGEEIIKRALFI